MTYNEQDVERVAKALYVAKHGDPDDWARETEAVRDKYRGYARAALDAIGPQSHGMRTGASMVAQAMGPREAVSREQVDDIVHGILGDTFSDSLTDRIVSDLHDAILALLPGNPAHVNERERCCDVNEREHASPQTVMTVEELEALDWGARFIDAEGAHWVAVQDGYISYNSDRLRLADKVPLPATVLTPAPAPREASTVTVEQVGIIAGWMSASLDEHPERVLEALTGALRDLHINVPVAGDES